MREAFVHALRTAILADHRVERLRPEEPAEHLRPVLAQRILQTLLRPRPEPIERNRKPRHAHTSHSALRDCLSYTQTACGSLRRDRFTDAGTCRHSVPYATNPA